MVNSNAQERNLKEDFKKICVNYHDTKDIVTSIGQFLPTKYLFVKGHIGNSEVLDVLCSIYVPIMNVTATWTSPFSVRKRQVMLDIPTFVAGLRRWLEPTYLDDVLAIPVRLVCQHLDKLVPSQVTYGSVHRVFVPTLHVFDGQVLYADGVYLVLVTQPIGQLVQEIFSLSCYLRVKPCYLLLLALVLRSPFFQLGKLLLMFHQLVLRLLQEHRAFNFVAIVKSQEGLHSKVYSYCSFPQYWFLLRNCHIHFTENGTENGDVVPSIFVLRHCCGLHRSLNLSRELAFDSIVLGFQLDELWNRNSVGVIVELQIVVGY